MKKIQKVIAVDLDGVILHYKKGWYTLSKLGSPIKLAKEGLKHLIDDYWYVIIYTCRTNVKEIEKHLKRFGILRNFHYNSINKSYYKGCKGKIGADIYLDDRSVCFTGNWIEAYKNISVFKPWEVKK